MDTDQAHVALGALKAVALADGAFQDQERRMLQAAMHALGLDIDIDALPGLHPTDVASRLPQEAMRTRLLQCQFIMAMMDGEVTEREWSVIHQYAKVLEVDEPRLNNMRQLVDGHLRMLQFDLLRHSTMMDDVLREAWSREGAKGVWRTLAPFEGFGLNPELASRYIALGELPEGTLGRSYFLHMGERGFGFPGEKRGFPEGFVKHDLCHVLSGYDTDPAGECEAGAFIAGFLQSDPFWYVFMITIHTHLGIEVFRGDPTGQMAFDPVRVLNALEHGMRVNRDLYAPDLDWWPYFERPLGDVRREFNIPEHGCAGVTAS